MTSGFGFCVPSWTLTSLCRNHEHVGPQRCDTRAAASCAFADTREEQSGRLQHLLKFYNREY